MKPAIRYDLPIAEEFEEQMTSLLREYKGDGEFLSIDDAPNATALCFIDAARGAVGHILFV